MNIKLYYATQGGTTEFVAKAFAEDLQKVGHGVQLYNVLVEPKLDTANADLIILAAPTYDMGNVEAAMAHFLANNNPDLTTVDMAVFGLGDSSFPEFCKSVEVLENWITAHHGTLRVESLKLDSYTQNFYAIHDWAQKVAQIVATT